MKINTANEAVMGMLKEVTRQTGLGSLFFDAASRQIATVGKLPSFCRWCLDDPRSAARCLSVYEEATPQALSSAEPFYHVCWAGLLYAVVAVAPFTHC
ncbi:MAG: PocR ligand-binding domain-containing protein, partial [Kiritimatiellia bacterium]